MIPSIAETWTAATSTTIPFREDDATDMRMLDLLVEMYVGKEFPFLTSSRDGFTYLIVPRTIVKVFNGNQIPTEAPSPVRLSNDGGRNGISN